MKGCTKQKEFKTADSNMTKIGFPCYAFFGFVIEGDIQCGPCHCHESRLYQVPEPESMPWVMKELINNSIGDARCKLFVQCNIEMTAFGGQEKHDEAAQHIKRLKSV